MSEGRTHTSVASPREWSSRPRPLPPWSEARLDKGAYFMTADDGIFCQKCICRRRPAAPDISFPLTRSPRLDLFDVLFLLVSPVPLHFRTCSHSFSPTDHMFSTTEVHVYTPMMRNCALALNHVDLPISGLARKVGIVLSRGLKREFTFEWSLRNEKMQEND